MTHNRGKMPLFCRVITGKSKIIKGGKEVKIIICQFKHRLTTGIMVYPSKIQKPRGVW